jgi:hypothetical protein
MKTTFDLIARARKLLWAAFLLFASAFVVGIANPSQARPMLYPCRYDNTCVTTTIRR